MSDLIVTRLINCPRCGQDHEDGQLARALTKPMTVIDSKLIFANWFLCPVVKEPVLITTTTHEQLSEEEYQEIRRKMEASGAVDIEYMECDPDNLAEEGCDRCGLKQDMDVLEMNEKDLAIEVQRVRDAIRYHRDQKGDDRCWLDDLKLYELLPETTEADLVLPPREEFLASCERYCTLRQPPKKE